MNKLRTRNKPWIPGALRDLTDIMLPEPAQYKGHWNQLFGNDHPIYLELGMGKGQFLTSLAADNPGLNFIGMEVQEQIIYYGTTLIKEQNLSNIKLLNENVNILGELFGPQEVGRIFINFCDPWPKLRHGRRRLTHRGFLQTYKKILKPESLVCFKTDNQDLFNFSLEEFKEAGYQLKNLTSDLHQSKLNETNILTEYEAKFIAREIKIYYCEAQTN